MASVAAHTHLTPEEYLAFERKATTKHEYLNGQIVAMSGASFAHNFITVNIATSLFEHYQQIVSLKDYILISQDEVRVEHYCCQESKWLQTEFQGLEDVLSLLSIGCELRLSDIYRRVKVASG